MIIRLHDEENTFALLKTDENVKVIEKLVEKYKAQNRDTYSIEGFLDFLMNQDIKFEAVIPFKADYHIYF